VSSVLRWVFYVCFFTLGLVLFSKATIAVSAERRVGVNPVLDMFNRGESAYKAKDYTTARDIFEEVVKVAPGVGAAWFRLGLVYQRLDVLDSSLRAYSTVLRLAGENPADAELIELSAKTRYNRGLLLLEASRLDFSTSFESLDPALQDAAKLYAKDLERLQAGDGLPEKKLVSVKVNESAPADTCAVQSRDDFKKADVSDSLEKKSLITEVAQKVPLRVTSLPPRSKPSQVVNSPTVEVFSGGGTKK
jgi:tetratricopeptide (TPR) repeat protein